MFWKIAAAIFLVCLLTVTLLTALLLLEARGLLRDTRAALGVFQGKLGALLDTAQDAAARARDASEQAKQTAIEQRSNLQAELREIRKVTVGAKNLVDHTDWNLNGTHDHPETGALPRMSAALGDTDALVKQTATNLQTASDELQPSLNNLARASAAAAEQMGNPKIGEAIAHADEISTNAAAAAQSLAGVAANAKTASDLALERLRAALKPVPFARALLEKFFGLATQGAQLYYGTH